MSKTCSVARACCRRWQLFGRERYPRQKLSGGIDMGSALGNSRRRLEERARGPKGPQHTFVSSAAVPKLIARKPPPPMLKGHGVQYDFEPEPLEL
jgi:hypothetical protein